MSRSVDALVEPRMLVWARKRLGLEPSIAAHKINVTEAKLAEWESGISRPTIVQAINLAELYHTPLSALYLDAPPRDFSVKAADFRRVGGAGSMPWSPQLRVEWLRANVRRETAMELAEDAASATFAGYRSATVAADAEEEALKWRGVLGIDLALQREMGESEEAGIGKWRSAVESQNVLVCFTDVHATKISPEEFRGFAISAELFPVITINAADGKAAQVFTLLHEFAHLLLGESGISNGWLQGAGGGTFGRTERWCNKFAAALLMPEAAFRAHPLVAEVRAQDDWPDADIEALAAEFGVSREAAVRRLLTLEYVSQAFYERKRSEYAKAYREMRAAKREEKHFGRSLPHRIALKRDGRPFARIVFQAFHDRRIGLSDVAGLLQTKVPYVLKMEQELFH